MHDLLESQDGFSAANMINNQMIKSTFLDNHWKRCSSWNFSSSWSARSFRQRITSPKRYQRLVAVWVFFVELRHSWAVASSSWCTMFSYGAPWGMTLHSGLVLLLPTLFLRQSKSRHSTPSESQDRRRIPRECRFPTDGKLMVSLFCRTLHLTVLLLLRPTQDTPGHTCYSRNPQLLILLQSPDWLPICIHSSLYSPDGVNRLPASVASSFQSSKCATHHYQLRCSPMHIHNLFYKRSFFPILFSYGSLPLVFVLFLLVYPTHTLC